MDRIRYLLLIEPTRWAEVLLGMFKTTIGFNLIAYLWDPPRSSAAMGTPLAVMIGILILCLGLSQIVLVIVESRWPRFYVCCIATGMWISLMGAQFLASYSVRTILIYIPLLIFNMVVALRITRGRN